MKNKAIIVVSFGTSIERAYLTGIKPIEDAVQAEFSDCYVVQAYSSGIIREKLRAAENIDIMSPAEAIAYQALSGCAAILVQPTFLIPGIEYEKLQKVVWEAQALYPGIGICLGKPLLYDENDLYCLAKMLITHNSGGSRDTAVIYMGHGSRHYSASIYFRILYYFKKNNSNLYMTLVEGEPSFNDVAAEVGAGKYAKAVLIPLMIVAGEHAVNDMASAKNDSLKSLLEAQGVSCECILDGLGSLAGVQALFVKHIRDLLI